MRLTEESTYEMVHSGLNALELSDDVTSSRIGNNAIIQESPSQLRRKQSNITGSTMVQTQDQSHSKKSIRDT